jgi:hypothetical protein
MIPLSVHQIYKLLGYALMDVNPSIHPSIDIKSMKFSNYLITTSWMWRIHPSIHPRRCNSKVHNLPRPPLTSSSSSIHITFSSQNFINFQVKPSWMWRTNHPSIHHPCIIHEDIIPRFIIFWDSTPTSSKVLLFSPFPSSPLARLSRVT